MITGIGTDIVKIDRIENLFSKFGEKFSFRILSSLEITKLETTPNKIAFLAKRFAAKEAIAKALGTGIGPNLSFKDIIISNNPLGGPIVSIERNIARGKNIMVSIGDEIDIAIAFAVVSQ